MFRKYHRPLKENQGKYVCYEVWVENFVYGSRSTKVADPKDPFGDGSSNPEAIVRPTYSLLIAFHGGTETLMMADRMARRVRASLAPPVLAYIY
ncbi:uncharacterized protein A4U43_C04F28850 [Asparagus officinalis]|uniref:Uncharacterized protein n=1 Tax=Asparagus officinalis TaxID=4686 RepID=A0A5P1F4Y9_ASPOF|nr:uncharacterized protein A4U43_C04F28850 [Asparagus officinalis]